MHNLQDALAQVVQQQLREENADDGEKTMT
jgi:hypothetical protein